MIDTAVGRTAFVCCTAAVKEQYWRRPRVLFLLGEKNTFNTSIAATAAVWACVLLLEQRNETVLRYSLCMHYCCCCTLYCCTLSDSLLAVACGHIPSSFGLPYLRHSWTLATSAAGPGYWPCATCRRETGICSSSRPAAAFGARAPNRKAKYAVRERGEAAPRRGTKTTAGTNPLHSQRRSNQARSNFLSGWADDSGQ